MADPTVGKKSPTGHPYPTLDRPRTEREKLGYLESSIVLALTMAPEGAIPVLMKNAEVAREIDYEEGEFVLLANQIRMIAGSIVWAVDPLTCACARDHSIAWQVTGAYLLRGKGKGMLPSPGWTGEYDWTGFLDPAHRPSLVDPREGFIATANNRTVPKDFPHQLTSSWYHPDRQERIAQVLEQM